MLVGVVVFVAALTKLFVLACILILCLLLPPECPERPETHRQVLI
jgi:hypothetical protein